MSYSEIPKNYQDETIERAIEDAKEKFSGDERTWSIYEVWFRHAYDISLENFDKIGMLYLTKVFGLDEETAKAFADGEKQDVVGYLMAGATEYKADSRGFWEEVHKLGPNLARSEDLEYLIENDENGTAGWAMINAIDSVLLNVKTLPGRLVTNALFYR